MKNQLSRVWFVPVVALALSTLSIIVVSGLRNEGEIFRYQSWDVLARITCSMSNAKSVSVVNMRNYVKNQFATLNQLEFVWRNIKANGVVEDVIIGRKENAYRRLLSTFGVGDIWKLVSVFDDVNVTMQVRDFAGCAAVVFNLDRSRKIAVGSRHQTAIGMGQFYVSAQLFPRRFLSVFNQVTSGEPEKKSEYRQDRSPSCEPDCGVRKNGVFMRFFFSMLLALCGLLLGVFGCKYLYSERIFLSAGLLFLSGTFGILGFCFWMFL